MFETLLVVFTILYSIQLILFFLSVKFVRYTADDSYRPNVSVIIAARNEETNIRSCLTSLAHIEYPDYLLEIILVDDQSEDGTARIIDEFAAQSTLIRHVTAQRGEKNLQGKANAVAQGVDVATGDVLMFTDADCTVPPTWVSDTVKYFSNESIGIVAGYTSLRARGVFQSIQSLDWFFLVTVAAATIGLRFPVTAVGTNFSVRRKAYDEVGGYNNISFSVTEDYALFHAITSRTRFRACLPSDEATLVESEPCSTLFQLFRQKLRWFRGGKDMSFPKLLLYSVSYAFHSLLCVAIFSQHWPAVSVALLLKLSCDFILLYPTIKRFKTRKLMKFFPMFELYYSAYILIFPILVILGLPIQWKDRKFS